MLIHWLFALAFVKCIAKPHSSSDSLMTVFILARHGERYPCHHLRHPSYPKEFNLRSCQLTENGAQQHYKLGQFIYDRYSNLLTSKGFKQVVIAYFHLFLRLHHVFLLFLFIILFITFLINLTLGPVKSKDVHVLPR